MGDQAKGREPAGRRRGSSTETIWVDVPIVWKRQLEEAAGSQAISLSALLRIILRGFLRERYSAAEQRELEVT